MKKILLPLLTLCALASCQNASRTVVEEEEERTEVVKNAKEVTFVMKGITEEYGSRATVQTAGMTDLWVWEGETLLKHQASTDADFGTPTLSLTYGSHDLTFVASKSDGQTWAYGKWRTTRCVADYGTTMTVTVSGNSSNSRQVQLTRRNGKVTIETTDKVPATVTKMRLKVQTCYSLTALLAGTDADYRNATIDMTSKQGSTYTVFMNTIPASATDEEDCSVLVEFLNASDAVLYQYERTVKAKANRNVVLKGNFFSGESNSVTISDADWEEVEQPLYSSE